MAKYSVKGYQLSAFGDVYETAMFLDRFLCLFNVPYATVIKEISIFKS